jgi:hypothetical protein
VRCDETGQTWTVPITANTVARPKAAAVLTLDHSGSMAEDAGDGVTKADKLREAAGIFVDAMLPGDGIGLVRFDDTVQRLMDVTDVGALGSGPGRATANGHITGPELDPAGATSIGGGVLEAKQALDDAQATASPPYAVRAIVVLTDGVENTPPTIASAAAGITANTFAIGLGLPSNISVAALDALTQGHHGYLLVTGALDVDQRTRLTKYFLQVLAGITNANVVLDPHGEIGEGEEHNIPFEVTEADYGLDAFVLTPYPQAVEYELEMPDGARIDAASFGALGTTEMLVRDGAALYRVALPADPGAPLGSHDGTWKVVLRVGRRSPWDRGDTLAAATRRGKDTTPYDVLIHTYSNLVFSAQAVQKTYEPGDVVRLYASLREYDVPVANRAGVWAEIVDPDGNQSVVTLKLGPNDQFAGSFHTSVPGLYRVRVRARGETFAGSAFSREQTTSAFALPGGDRTPDTGGNDRLAQLVCCLLHSKQGLACIKRLGGDELLRCVRRVCAPSRRSD